jgi:hypothetical protein
MKYSPPLFRKYMEDTEAAKIRYIYQGLKNICESATCASCNLGFLAGKGPPCIIYKVTQCSVLFDVRIRPIS